MIPLRELARSVRAKNAGPFWLTLDIFLPDEATYLRVSEGLDTGAVAKRFRVEAATIQRYDLAALHAIKISLPRPERQGARLDRDMHGAAFAVLIADLPIA